MPTLTCEWTGPVAWHAHAYHASRSSWTFAPTSWGSDVSDLGWSDPVGVEFPRLCWPYHVTVPVPSHDMHMLALHVELVERFHLPPSGDLRHNPPKGS